MSSFVLQQQAPTQRQFVIPAEGLRIGRTPENGVQLPDDVVSRHHATLWVQGEQVYIRDEGTTNGTLVCGQKIAAGTPVSVQAGDEIRIGTAVFVVNLGPVVAASPVVVAAAPASLPATRTNPVYLVAGLAIFGLVVAIVIISALSGPRPAFPIPLPTATLTPPPEVASTVTAVASPTPPIVTLTPTAPIIPPAALPVVSPEPVIAPITLIEPQSGASFGGSDAYILLRWTLNRTLNTGERYQVTLDCDRMLGPAPEMGDATDPQWQVPAHIYNSLAGARQCRWRVRVIASDGSPTSPDSAVNWFVWEKGPDSLVSPLPIPTMER